MPSNIEKEEIVECYTRMRDAHLQEAKRLSHCLEEFEKKWSVAEEDAAHPKKRRREKKGKKKAKHKKKAKYKKKEDGDEGGEGGDQRDGDEGEGGGDGDEKRDAEMKEKDLCSPRTESSPVPELLQPNCMRCSMWGSGVELDSWARVVRREAVCRACGASAPSSQTYVYDTLSQPVQREAQQPVS